MDVEDVHAGFRKLARFAAQGSQAAGRGFRSEHGRRMRLERQDCAAGIARSACGLAGNGQQLLVPEMNAIEIAEGDHLALA